MMEFSLAIKSPSIHYHLAGTKKVQQELARDGVLEKFLGDKVKIDSVKDIFTGLYSLDKVMKYRIPHTGKLSFAEYNSLKCFIQMISYHCFYLRLGISPRA